MRKAIAPPTLPSAVAVGLLAIVTLFGASACSSAPSAQARACTSRSHLETSLEQLRAFDYTNGRGSDLAADLDSARQGLIGLESAVHLPQQTGLQQLGGVGRLRQLEAEVRTLASSVQSSSDVSSFENAVRQRATEMQQVVGTVSGC